MLSIVIPSDQEKIKKQITALEWILTQDIPHKDRKIYTDSLKQLKSKLKEQ